MKGVKIAGGTGGLYRTILWSQVLEFDDIKEWINPGVLIFFTGAAFTNWKKDMQEVVLQAYEKNAAGIVFYVGPYIKEIPKHVIEMADDINFPILTLPIEVRLADVTYQMAQTIFNNEMHQENIEKTIRDIRKRNINESTIDKIRKLDFIGKEYQCIVVSNDDKSELSEFIKRNIRNLMKNILDIYYIKSIINGDDDTVILLAYNSNTIGLEEILYKVIENVKTMYPDMNLYFSVGNKVTNLNDLSVSMEQAEITKDIFQKLNKQNKILYYQKLGIARFLFCKDISKEVSQFIEDYLQELLKLENLILFQTLKCYLSNGNNMKKTSEEMFVHLNTLKYRIKKIEELGGRSLKEVNYCYNLYTAIQLQEIMK